MSGLTPQGFLTKRLIEIKEELENELTETFGAVDLRPESVFGQLVGLQSERLARIWELLEEIYLSQYPDSATGSSLDQVAALVGIIRRPATATQVQAWITGDNGLVLPPNTQAVAENDDLYSSVGGNQIAQSRCRQIEIVVDIVEENDYTITIDATNYTYASFSSDTDEDIILGLESQLSFFTTEIIDDELLRVTFAQDTSVSLSPNLSFETVTSTALFVHQELGARFLAINTLNQIQTPVSGLSSINNPEAAITGREIETDTELRERREESITITARHTVDALLAKLRQVPLVIDVVVSANNSETTDGNGTPRQHIWTIIEGGEEEEIGQILYDTVAAGIGYRGQVEVQVTSEISGNQTFVKFDRPTYIDIAINLAYTPLSNFPPLGEELLEEEFLKFSDTFNIAENLTFSKFYKPINAVPGVQVDLLEINGSQSNIPVSFEEKIRILPQNITINETT